MSKIITSLLLFLAALSGLAQTQINGKVTGPLSTFIEGSGSPSGTCNTSLNLGVVYFDHANQNIWFCTAGGWAQGSATTPSYNSLPQPVLNASATNISGADIGARVNTLYTNLTTAGQVGTVTLDPTALNGSQTTIIKVPLGDTLDCQGATLNYAGTSAQIVYGSAYGGGGTQSQQGAIRNCTMIGTGNTGTAIYAGGDPAGVISPSGNYGDGLILQNDVIKGYGTGYTHGSNAYNNIIFMTEFLDNTNDIVSAPTNATNEGEATKVLASVISNATGCGFLLNNVADVYYMSGGSLDYNGFGVCGSAANITLRDVWQEQYFGPIVDVYGPLIAVDAVRSSGGTVVLTAQPSTITNVSLTSNVLTITLSAPPTGYLAGHTLQFSALTTATFLNGQQANITSVSGNTVVLAYTHANYTSAADSGTATPASASLWDLEGNTGSQIIVDTPDIYQPAGVVSTGINLGATTGTQACLRDILGPHEYTIGGTAASGCRMVVPLQQDIGTSRSIISPSAAYQTAGQGFNIAWNVGLMGLTGEMDFINTDGTGTGGFAFCNGTYNFTPGSGTCPMYFNGTTGELYLPAGLSPSELVGTDANNGLVSITTLPSSVTSTSQTWNGNNNFYGNQFFYGAASGFPISVLQNNNSGGTSAGFAFVPAGGHEWGIGAPTGSYGAPGNTALITTDYSGGGGPGWAEYYSGSNLIFSLPSSTIVSWNGDTGISRSAADAFLFGNGTTGDASASIAAASAILNGNVKELATSSGVFQLTNAAANGFTQLILGPATSGFPGLCVSGTSLTVCDGSGGTAAILKTPTQAISTNNTDVATTAAVTSALAGYASTSTTNIFSLLQSARGFAPQIAQANGPYSVYFNDWYTAADNVANQIVGSGATCAINNLGAFANANHPGNLLLSSNTTSGDGVACGLEATSSVILSSQSTQPWGAETSVVVEVLPGTTAATYQFGLPASPNSNPWTTAIGFILSSTDGVANDWYCRYGTTSVDSTTVATTTFTRLSIVSDGTNVHWYINGSQVCGTGVALTSMPNNALYPPNYTAVTLTASTAVLMGVDYTTYVSQVNR